MSKVNTQFNYSHQWITQMRNCKRVARIAAALIENASDPFYYARQINYFQRGIEKVDDVNDYVKHKMDTLSVRELGVLTARVNVIIDRDGT